MFHVTVNGPSWVCGAEEVHLSTGGCHRRALGARWGRLLDPSIVLDLVVAALAIIVAFFFALAARQYPDQGFGWISASFVAFAVATTSFTAASDLRQASNELIAQRGVAGSLNAVMFFLAYAIPGQARARWRNIVGWAAFSAGVGYLVAELVTDVVSAVQVFIVLRLVDVCLLMFTVGVIAARIKRPSMQSFLVPTALVVTVGIRGAVLTAHFQGWSVPPEWVDGLVLVALALFIAAIAPARRYLVAA